MTFTKETVAESTVWITRITVSDKRSSLTSCIVFFCVGLKLFHNEKATFLYICLRCLSSITSVACFSIKNINMCVNENANLLRSLRNYKRNLEIIWSSCASRVSVNRRKVFWCLTKLLKELPPVSDAFVYVSIISKTTTIRRNEVYGNNCSADPRKDFACNGTRWDAQVVCAARIFSFVKGYVL